MAEESTIVEENALSKRRETRRLNKSHYNIYESTHSIEYEYHGGKDTQNKPAQIRLQTTPEASGIYPQTVSCI